MRNEPRCERARRATRLAPFAGGHAARVAGARAVVRAAGDARRPRARRAAAACGDGASEEAAGHLGETARAREQVDQRTAHAMLSCAVLCRAVRYAMRCDAMLCYATRSSSACGGVGQATARAETSSRAAPKLAPPSGSAAAASSSPRAGATLEGDAPPAVDRFEEGRTSLRLSYGKLRSGSVSDDGRGDRTERGSAERLTLAQRREMAPHATRPLALLRVAALVLTKASCPQAGAGGLAGTFSERKKAAAATPAGSEQGEGSGGEHGAASGGLPPRPRPLGRRSSAHDMRRQSVVNVRSPARASTNAMHAHET